MPTVDELVEGGAGLAGGGGRLGLGFSPF